MGRWQKTGVFKFNRADRKKPIYGVDNPPSFTSGTLHMGHVLNHTWIDVIARYKRMRGYNVFFPIGYDCHGLPTELKVQYELGIPREDTKRFRDECIKLTKKNIARMDEQYRSIGYSADWDLCYKTMSDEYVKMVQLSLLKFHDMGLIYRSTFPVLWCPRCTTALAKSELGYVKRGARLYYIKLDTTLGKTITIATTRPEMMGACVAVFVHPNDRRYSEYVGSSAIVPIYKRKVPILTDDGVDMEFGTGVVYLCTYGDAEDVRWQRKYKLPAIVILAPDGVLNEKAGPYAGLTLEEARKKIVQKLKGMGRIVKDEELVHEVLSHTERSSCMSPIEFLPVPQWFIKIDPLRKGLLRAAKKIEWYPDFMVGRLTDWIDALDWDWIISRQRVFGTPIPFWYCEDCGEIIPPREEDLPVDPAVDKPPTKACPKCGSKKLMGSRDICDCWVDSSITPLFITGWEREERLFKRTYPMSLRPQGYEIIRTWLFYTVLRCLKLTGEIPFKDALINGMVAGPDGRKMSKSFGNVIEPDEVLSKYPADALRQWAVLATHGMDYPFSWKEVEAGQKMLTKIWNASRFAAAHLKGYKGKRPKVLKLTPLDHWILGRLDGLIEAVTEDLDEYRFNTFLKVRDFFWHEFCDHYLESVKPRLYQPEDFGRGAYEAACYVLYTVLFNSMKLLAPFVPFITEEIYHNVLNASERESIHSLDWSKPLKIADPVKARAGKVARDVIAEARRLKSVKGIPLSRRMASVTVTVPSKKVVNAVTASSREIAETLGASELKVVVGDVKEVTVQIA